MTFIHEKYTLNSSLMLNWTNVPANVSEFKKVLSNLPTENEPYELLEIGTFNGTSAIGFLEILPKSHITVVDPWMPYEEMTQLGVNMVDIEEVFDSNIEKAGVQSRVTKMKKKSGTVLREFLHAKKAFDFIYVDGNHTALAVLQDSILAWELLKPKGVMVWDDFLWRMDLAPHLIPKPAINHFLDEYRNEYTVVMDGYRKGVIKL